MNARDDGSPRRDEEARRRRRLEVFGDVLPDSTSDDRDPADSHGGSRGGSGKGSGGARTSDDTTNDEWLEANVPPHHG